jgi:asparagine N-glycosylation enzyme membrane subunit Stt3
MLLFNGWVLILVILLSFSFFMSVYNIVKKKSSFKNSFLAASISIPSAAYFYCFNILHDNLMPDFVFKLSLGILAALAVIVYTDIVGALLIRKNYVGAAVSFSIPVVCAIVFREAFSFLQGFLISRTAFFLPQSEVIRQIQELQPVTPAMYVSAFTSLILMVVFGSVLLFLSLRGKKWSRPRLPDAASLCMLGVWLLFSLYLSVTLNRFLFTAAPGICAFSGMSFYYFLNSAEKSLRSPIVRLLATYSVIFLYVLVPLFSSFYTYSQQEPYITPSWEKASYWLYNNTSKDASILTEWDQSNWFQALAGRCTATDTIMAQNPEKAANFFCTSPKKGLSYIQYKRIQYIALDKHTVARYYVMLPFAKSPVSYENSALCALYYGEFSGMDLVFEDEDVKMFKVVYETAFVSNFFFEISDEKLYVTIFTVNPLDEPVDVNCIVRVQNDADIFSRSIIITAEPGTHSHTTVLDLPALSRFFIVLEQGNHAPLVRAVFLK